MKVGILTLPLHINYGGILQAYALQTVLKNNGYDAQIVNYTTWNLLPPRLPRPVRYLIYLKNTFLYLFNGAGTVMPDIKLRKNYTYLTRHLTPFVDEYIDYIPLADIKEHRKKVDAIVVGSDQIWRPSYQGHDFIFFLDFLPEKTDIKRIAYAASFGTDQWEYTEEETRRSAALIARFDLVSVRESSAVELCRRHWNIPSHVVLDPTLLLEPEEYIRLTRGIDDTPAEEGLFYYFLDATDQKMDYVHNVSEKLGLRPFQLKPTVPHIKRKKYKGCLFREASVATWLHSFHRAKFILTDSFHGCVFSIIFNKPFYVIGNKRRGMARFDSLLKLFGLEDRLIDISETGTHPIDTDIDWDTVNAIRKEKKNTSFMLLHEALQNK